MPGTGFRLGRAIGRALGAGALAALIVGALPVSIEAAPLFSAAQELIVPGIPTIADVNNDGKPDLIIANNAASGAVSVLLGNGDGTFGSPTQFTTAPNPAVAVIGDINCDGKADIVTANQSAQSVSILLGNGDGTFATPQNISTGIGATALAIADLNGDPYPDMVVVNHASNTISILLGTGGGAFAPRVDIPDSLGPMQLVIGDFREDGIPDVVVSETAGSVAVLPGHGDGTFASAIRTSVGGKPTALVAEDFNLDGHLDLAVMRIGGTPGGVQILLGSGGGGFSHGSNFTLGDENYSLTVADMNQDGIPDLIGTGTDTFADHSWVQIFIGLGDGTFPLRGTYDTGNAVGPVATGDLDGDGKVDVVVGNGSLGGSSPLWSSDQAVFLGIGDGTLAGKVDYDGLYTVFVAAGDLNGDGSPDLLTVDYYGEFVIWLDNLAGALTRSATLTTTFTSEWFRTRPAIADMNGDGKPDIVTQSRDSLTVLLGYGNGTFATPISHSTSSNATEVAVADFNGDGLPDVATANGGASTASVFLGHGDGTVGDELQLHPGTNCSSIAAADLNGDHHPDLVVAAQNDDAVSVLLGNGDGTFGPPVVFPTGAGPMRVLIGDFNEDGILDVVTSNYHLGSSTVSLLLGQGGGTFLPVMNLPSGSGWTARAVGDVNHDGHLDVVSTNGLATSVMPGNGDGTFGQALQFQGGGEAVIADFKTDGKLDVATTYSVDDRYGRMSVFLNDMDRLVVPATPNIIASTTSLDFGQVAVGVTGSASLVLTNTGTGLGRVLSVDNTGAPFSAPALGFALSVNHPVHFAAKFTPTSPGTFDGSIAIHTDDPAHPTITVQLHGQGLGEASVSAQAKVELALAGMVPNPSVRELSVSFSLPDDSPASLELMDLAGRRVRSIDVGAQGPGHHVISLGNAGSLPTGVYLVRLRHAQRTLVAKAVVMR
jgi:hypothetical protein